jgi:DNA mismatch repair protein MutL
MSIITPNINATVPVIRQLDDAAINRIAAGEVVERPASAVKELVENSIDAGARRISVDIADGGKTLIRVTDDGWGIAPDELPLALSRHATSKIDGTDLLNIHSFGFRGEALPSLGAVGRLKITSKREGHDAMTLVVDGSQMSPPQPASLNSGTQVELRDLFFATPARLKFMRTDRAEAQAVADILKRLAMSEPSIRFTLRDVSSDKDRLIFDYLAQNGDLLDALHGRLLDVLGRDFADNSLRIDATRDAYSITGYAALPTFSRGAAVMQFFFVNGRPVKDKQLIGAMRAAYSDFLSRDRHPAVALFIECDPHMVDVNVHPAKSEVRFRDPGAVRGLVVASLKHALAEAGHRSSTTVSAATLGAFTPERPATPIYQMDRPSMQARTTAYTSQAPLEASPQFAEAMPVFARVDDPQDIIEAPEAHDTQAASEEFPLGAARGQVHENYIIAQTATGMVIVDQHAAHERLVYEKLKAQMADTGVASQALLIPDIVDLPQDACLRLLEQTETLESMGLYIEAFGGSAIAVRETPAILGQVDAQGLIKDIADELEDLGESQNLQARIEAILSRVACHGSIRSGRRMRVEEMNALLRDMEATPHSGQCNHGRPTYVELKLSDIERLFGRTT